MRDRKPIWNSDRINAGSAIEENHGPTPCEIGAKPLEGTQPSCTLNRITPRMAIQNAGIDTPSSAVVMTSESIQVRRK